MKPVLNLKLSSETKRQQSVKRLVIHHNYKVCTCTKCDEHRAKIQANRDRKKIKRWLLGYDD